MARPLAAARTPSATLLGGMTTATPFGAGPILSETPLTVTIAAILSVVAPTRSAIPPTVMTTAIPFVVAQTLLATPLSATTMATRSGAALTALATLRAGSAA